MEEVPQYWNNLSLENIRYIDPDGIERHEEWKPITDYEEVYEISNLGRVKSLGRLKNIHFSRILKQAYSAGYLGVSLCKNGEKKTVRVHNLVGNYFIPNPFNKKTINHKRGIREDNRYFSLEWHTYKENNDHAVNVLLRKTASAENIPSSKKVLCINNNITYPSIGEASRKLKIPESCISDVCNGKRNNTKGYYFKFTK